MPVGYRGVVVVSSVAALALVAVTACGGAGKYAGSYKRELYGEGDVLLKLGTDGTVELTLPAPRWADSPNMTGKASFKGDTLVFPADTAIKCASSEARYVFSASGEDTQVSGVGMDGCGARHAALEGAWKKS
ncbi:MAG TPA: hypothetical protein VIE46_07855 [Gemmatimonadales bacterium]